MNTERSLGTRIAMIAAEVLLAGATVALIVAVWLPIEGFRNWLKVHFFH